MDRVRRSSRDPGPADVAIAYETAWDKLDFDLLFDLSGEELRDGLRRAEFIAQEAFGVCAVTTRGIGAEVVVDDVVATRQTAVVATRVTTPEGSVQNRVLLEKRPIGWLVVGYSIRTDMSRAARAPLDRGSEPAHGHRQGDDRVARRDARGACGAGARRGVRPGDRGRVGRHGAARGARSAAGRGAACRARRGSRRARARSARSSCWRATCRSSSRRSLQLLAEWPGAGTVIPQCRGRLQYGCAALRPSRHHRRPRSHGCAVEARCGSRASTATRSLRRSCGTRSRRPNALDDIDTPEDRARTIGP